MVEETKVRKGRRTRKRGRERERVERRMERRCMVGLSGQRNMAVDADG